MADRPSYTELVKILRPFYRIPAGKLTPQKKRFLTVKFKELNAKGATKFHAMPAKRREQFKAAGYTTTRKGVFIPQRPGEKFELRKSHVKWTIQTAAVNREEFEFPLTRSRTRQFLNDPTALINKIKSENPRIFNAKRRKLADEGRELFRLVFSKGTRQEVLDIELLAQYIRIITEPLTDVEEPDVTAARKGRILNAMTSLRVSYIVPRKR